MSVSPYSYAVGNPVNVVDINGDSIWYSVNENIITMHVTGSIINQSSSNVDLQKKADKIASGIVKSFSGNVEINGNSYTMVVDAQIGVANSMDDVSGSDHLFVIADRMGNAPLKAEGATSELGGKVMTVHSGASTRSMVHEFGHAAGLTHRSASGSFNLMHQGRNWATSITSDQRSTMIKAYQSGNINRGVNYYNPNPYNPNSIITPNPYVIFYDGSRRVIQHINGVGLKYK